MTPPDAGPLPLDDQLCFAVYSTGMAIQRLYKPLLDGLGLTYPQYLVLNVLWQDTAQPVGAIAERLALESSTLTPLLKRLEAAGLVTRTRNPADERQVLVALTPAGQALRERTGCVGAALLAGSGRSMAELGALNRQLRALRDAIYADAAPAPPPDAPG
jgi:DNA-binding MarR family transcriptional regulator